MHVTLAEYNRLTPEERAKVTSIDATIACDYEPHVFRPNGQRMTQAEIDADWDYSRTGSTPNPEWGE